MIWRVLGLLLISTQALASNLQMSTTLSSHASSFSPNPLSQSISFNKPRDQDFSQIREQGSAIASQLGELRLKNQKFDLEESKVKDYSLKKITPENRVAQFLERKQNDPVFQLKREYSQFETAHKNYPINTPLQKEVKDLSYEAYSAGLVHLSTNAYEESKVSLGVAYSLLDVGLSLTPGVSVGRDAYELLTGKNLLTGEALDSFDRAVSLVGVATLGTSNLAKGSFKTIQKLSRSHFGDQTIEIAQEIVKRAPWGEIKKIMGHLRYGGGIADKADRKKVVVAFSHHSKLEVLKEDKIVYRYFDNVYSFPRGRWLTDVHFADMSYVKGMLALESFIDESKLQGIKWIIPKGTTVIEGLIQPTKSARGGMQQFFILDSSVLKEVL